MPEMTENVAALPMKVQGPFQEFTQRLSEVAGEKLLGFSAFGGWLAGDPLYADAPARSVVVLLDFDLRLLARLAEHGVRMGQLGLQAPLIMTPAYIAASGDVFPLELLEIQQLHIVLAGADHFASLQFDRQDLRLQCERDLKSELIHLHQGLLSSAGRYRQLGDLCRREAERAVRVLRGVLYLAGAAIPRLSDEIAASAATTTHLPLVALRGVLTGTRIADLNGFTAFYNELSAVADYVDRLDGR